MYKKIIEKHLRVKINEDKVPGVITTDAVKKETGDANEEYYKDVAKKFEVYEKVPVTKEKPVKRELSKDEIDVHDHYETLNGLEMNRYDGGVDEVFQQRTKEAIEGSSKMGNNPEWANVYPKQQGFAGPEFGKELAKRVGTAVDDRTKREEDRKYFGVDGKLTADENPRLRQSNAIKENVEDKSTYNLRTVKIHFDNGETITTNMAKTLTDDEILNYYQIGRTFNLGSGDKDNLAKVVNTEILDDSVYDKKTHTPINNDNINENKKMKRLKFKNPFNGHKNALTLIPENYKKDMLIFEMTDGIETYKIRWEGKSPVILEAKNQNLINEEMSKIKKLMGYTSRETLGNLKGTERLNEDVNFKTIMGKTKGIIKEDELGRKYLDLNESTDGKTASHLKVTAPEATPGKEKTGGKGMTSTKEKPGASGIDAEGEAEPGKEKLASGTKPKGVKDAQKTADHLDVDSDEVTPGEEKTGGNKSLGNPTKHVQIKKGKELKHDATVAEPGKEKIAESKHTFELVDLTKFELMEG